VLMDLSFAQHPSKKRKKVAPGTFHHKAMRGEKKRLDSRWNKCSSVLRLKGKKDLLDLSSIQASQREEGG